MRILTPIAAGCLLALACAGDPPAEPAPPTPPPEDTSGIDRRHLDIPHVDSSAWVDVYLPQLAFNGYTVDMYKRRVPAVTDMNGHIVHSWPLVRATGRARLTTDGHLYVIGIDGAIKEYDWDGNLTWRYDFPEDDDLPHHDLIQLANGHYLVLARSDADSADYLIEVDRGGDVVWRWWAPDHLDDTFPGWNPDAHDPTHINSVHEIPPNRWFDAGDERFRPGNILVSVRNMNALIVIDKRTGRIVWTHSEGLDYQHEASMIPQGTLGAGNVVYFNNRYHAADGERRSAIEVIDPRTGEVLWSYENRHFFSSTAGSVQALPNGNLLVSSSQGGRVFEIRRTGQVVWQFVPPYLPMRALRYERDHCPQLAALPELPVERVDPRSKRPFVSIELSKLALPEGYDVRQVHGSRRQVLRESTTCGTLVFPPYAGMLIQYGLDDARLGPGELEARFVATLQGPDDPEPVVVLDDVVSRHDDELWRKQLVAAQHYPYRSVEMCVEAVAVRAEPPALERAITWENPQVSSPYRPRQFDRLNPDDLTREERELQEEQLRAIGYIQ